LTGLSGKLLPIGISPRSSSILPGKPRMCSIIIKKSPI
jgi:hypothetical protein